MFLLYILWFAQTQHIQFPQVRSCSENIQTRPSREKWDIFIPHKGLHHFQVCTTNLEVATSIWSAERQLCPTNKHVTVRLFHPQLKWNEGMEPQHRVMQLSPDKVVLVFWSKSQQECRQKPLPLKERRMCFLLIEAGRAIARWIQSVTKRGK